MTDSEILVLIESRLNCNPEIDADFVCTCGEAFVSQADLEHHQIVNGEIK